MSNDLDVEDTDWMCPSCLHTNPDCDESCNGCGEARYPAEEEDDSLSNLYSDETNRMIEAQRMK